jgi:hypothetical protein
VGEAPLRALLLRALLLWALLVVVLLLLAAHRHRLDLVLKNYLYPFDLGPEHAGPFKIC